MDYGDADEKSLPGTGSQRPSLLLDCKTRAVEYRGVAPRSGSRGPTQDTEPFVNAYSCLALRVSAGWRE